MITKNNFRDVLKHLGFTEKDDIFSKEIKGNELRVDFANQKLIYPNELIVNENQTTNFSAPENFVVFECVHRLLEKDYHPRHIELEKRWKLGHSQKSGRADITIYSDDKGTIFSIIECKTAGREYDKAKNQVNNDGGQLFSYWQQDKSVQCLSLYASDFDEEKKLLSFQNLDIRCRDDENIIRSAEKDKSVLLYQKANTVQELHKTWLDTYSSKTEEHLLFGENAVAYVLDKASLRKRDLKEFTPDDKIINQFEEILRHNVVSDKENAFNRLVALFICKLADEIDKNEDDEVEFQYKVNDRYEDLLDRLQRLYKVGMDKFMKEEIFYIPQDYAKKLFQDIGNRENTISDLEETIRKLKFYSNSDFAFKDVHNEELFYQNGKILVEMVQLFEKYRIIYPSKHQFLGDLFEQLLNKGFKQNEGQFFTPAPITRFIWDSLPLKTILEQQDGYPKVIDYACGSGHFLTEAVEAINAIKANSGNNDWTQDSIFGIEKDYRLARVSKVSMFMNGAGKSNIIFGDGLDNDKGIDNEKFDILVANPPYSVSAFKSHLKLKNNNLELLEFISNNGGEIEVLFVERIEQLLKSGGVGAVILPSSILSNDSSSYIAARQLLLNEFHMRAIVNFGSKTFGATGTNTVVLFLEKRNYPPKQKGLSEDISRSLFTEEKFEQVKDKEVYQAYLNHIKVSKESYDKLRKREVAWSDLTSGIENDYLEARLETIVSSIKLTKSQEKLEQDKQEAEKLKQFHAQFSKSEQERIALFSLLRHHQTLIINAPSNNAQQKEFLGYDWSNRKGQEGIKILNEGGKLYNATNRSAADTLASLVRSSFDERKAILDNHKEYAYWLDTVDMIDFTGVNFNRAIKTSVQKKVEIHSKFDLVKLNTICEILRGVTYSKNNQVIDKTTNIILPADNITLDGKFELNKAIYLDENIKLDDSKKLKQNDIFMCFSSGSEKHIGKLCFIEEDTNYYAGGFMGILRLLDIKNINPKYLYNVLNLENMRDAVRALSSGSNIKNLSNAIGELKFPLPPLGIQQQIVAECEKVDEEYENSRMRIEEYREKIAKIFQDLEVAYRSGGGE